MKWITVNLSPDAKHALKWLHTWLGIAAASAPLAYEHIDAVQGWVSETLVHDLTAALVILMIYNSMRAKHK